jgi:glycosyltransferase involved in cell wall biosynthesis
MISVSIVVPVYSGEAYLEKLVEKLTAVRERWCTEKAPVSLLELIFVDDGSKDNSPEIINKLSIDREWVRPVHLSRNYGQHPATIAGILLSKGDWVVTLDEDLQHPPERIEDLLSHAVRTGNDIVYAQPLDAIHESAARDMSSRIYKKIIRYLSGNQNVHLFSSFRLMRGTVARAASDACGHSTYFDMALSWFSQHISTVEMTLKDDRYIQTGKSGYKLRSLLSHARKMLITSQVKALRVGSAFGAVVLGMSILGSCMVLAQKLMYSQTIAPTGWASLALLILFFSGAIVFILGIILEYISILILDAHGKPLFFIVDRSGDAEIAAYYERNQLMSNGSRTIEKS